MIQEEYIGGTNTINRKLGKNQNLLEYGDILSEYHGTGNLIVVDGVGEKQFDCSFEAAQYTNGEIIILCHNLPPFIDFLISYSPVKKFEGKTEEGWKFRSNDATNSSLSSSFINVRKDFKTLSKYGLTNLIAFSLFIKSFSREQDA